MTRKIVKKKPVKKSKKVAKAVKKKAPKAKKPTIAQRIAKAKKEAERAKDSISRGGQKLFGEAVKDIFKKHKDLKQFSWNQYAPHWNDGDECVFGVYLESLTINDEVAYEDSEDIWTLERIHKLLSNKEKEKKRILKEIDEKSGNKDSSWEVESLKRDLESIESRDFKEVDFKYKIKRDITDLLEGIDDSVFKDMFGEGTVVVTREGTSVEECEHD